MHPEWQIRSATGFAPIRRSDPLTGSSPFWPVKPCTGTRPVPGQLRGATPGHFLDPYPVVEPGLRHHGAAAETLAISSAGRLFWLELDRGDPRHPPSKSSSHIVSAVRSGSRKTRGPVGRRMTTPQHARRRGNGLQSLRVRNRLAWARTHRPSGKGLGFGRRISCIWWDCSFALDRLQTDDHGCQELPQVHSAQAAHHWHTASESTSSTAQSHGRKAAGVSPAPDLPADRETGQDGSRVPVRIAIRTLDTGPRWIGTLSFRRAAVALVAMNCRTRRSDFLHALPVHRRLHPVRSLVLPAEPGRNAPGRQTMDPFHVLPHSRPFLTGATRREPRISSSMEWNAMPVRHANRRELIPEAARWNPWSDATPATDAHAVRRQGERTASLSV